MSRIKVFNLRNGVLALVIVILVGSLVTYLLTRRHARATPTVHYYLSEIKTEEDTGYCMMVEYGEPETPPPPEFREVTVEELHRLGLLTPTEQWRLTPPECVSTVSR